MGARSYYNGSWRGSFTYICIHIYIRESGEFIRKREISVSIDEACGGKRDCILGSLFIPAHTSIPKLWSGPAGTDAFDNLTIRSSLDHFAYGFCVLLEMHANYDTAVKCWNGHYRGQNPSKQKKGKKKGGGGKEKDITEGRELPVPACLVLEPSSLI